MPTLTEPTIGPPPPIIPVLPTGGDGSNNPDRDASGKTARIAVYIGMFASTVTFSALAAAMFFRRGLNPLDWKHVPVPPLLWWNTVALVLSSVAVEMARRAFRAGHRAEFRVLWSTGTVLGAWFLIGQSMSWKFLTEHGFHLQHNPASAFFYVLTWTHAAHVIGALAGLIYVAVRALVFRAIPLNRTVMEISAIFWHFLDVMWLILMAIFVLWA